MRSIFTVIVVLLFCGLLIKIIFFIIFCWVCVILFFRVSVIFCIRRYFRNGRRRVSVLGYVGNGVSVSEVCSLFWGFYKRVRVSVIGRFGWIYLLGGRDGG